MLQLVLYLISKKSTRRSEIFIIVLKYMIEYKVINVIIKERRIEKF